LQRLIAFSQSLGIPKSELMNNYYIDELSEVFYEHRKLQEQSLENEEVDYVDFKTFFW